MGEFRGYGRLEHNQLCLALPCRAPAFGDVPGVVGFIHMERC